MTAAVALADMEHRLSFSNSDPPSLAVRAEGREGHLPTVRAMKLFHFFPPFRSSRRTEPIDWSFGHKTWGWQTAYRCFSQSVNTLHYGPVSRVVASQILARNKT